jgi:HAMP domain-containing protein
MPLKRLRVLNRLPLQAAITIPFVFLVAAAVGMIGYLSYKNSQATVNALAFQLRSELTARILQQLEDTVSRPNVINQINASALLRGNLDLLTGKGEQQLWQQMQVFPATNLIYCATEADGAFLGVGRSQGGIGDTLQVQVANPSTDRYFHFFDVDDQGQRLELSRIDEKPYDPRLRPWYEAAKTKGEPTWSEVYLDFETLLPTITANVPVYLPGSQQLLGVCAADVILSEELNTFLQNLDISPSGMAFIVDTSGLLIASSTPEPITAGEGEDTVLLTASDSLNPLIQAAVGHLRSHYQTLDQVQSSQLELVQAKERYFLQVSRFTDDLGLDWVLVLMMPEADFMDPIHHQNQVTFVLYVLSLLLAAAIGLLLAHWVIRPLNQLSNRASEIAQGNWHDPIELDRSDAIGQLSRSLATMARQLKESWIFRDSRGTH